MMPVFEYMLWLRMKVMREDIADFVRGITPALFNLSLRYLKNVVGIDLRSYSDSKDQLFRANFEKTSKGKEILAALDEKYYGGLKDKCYISSDQCVFLIGKYGSDRRVADTFAEIRDFETKIRHKIAHDIVKIDTARNIMNKLKYVASRTVNIAPACWESYERMNELLKEAVKTGN